MRDARLPPGNSQSRGWDGKEGEVRQGDCGYKGEWGNRGRGMLGGGCGVSGDCGGCGTIAVRGMRDAVTAAEAGVSSLAL